MILEATLDLSYPHVLMYSCTHIFMYLYALLSGSCRVGSGWMEVMSVRCPSHFIRYSLYRCPCTLTLHQHQIFVQQCKVEYSSVIITSEFKNYLNSTSTQLNTASVSASTAHVPPSLPSNPLYPFHKACISHSAFRLGQSSPQSFH